MQGQLEVLEQRHWHILQKLPLLNGIKYSATTYWCRCESNAAYLQRQKLMKWEGLITLNDDAVRRSVSQIVTVLKDMLSANYAGSLVLHALALHVLALPPQAIPKFIVLST